MVAIFGFFTAIGGIAILGVIVGVIITMIGTSFSRRKQLAATKMVLSPMVFQSHQRGTMKRVFVRSKINDDKDLYLTEKELDEVAIIAKAAAADNNGKGKQITLAQQRLGINAEAVLRLLLEVRHIRSDSTNYHE